MTDKAVQVEVAEVVETAVTITLFTPFEQQLRDLEIFNEGIVFDYRAEKDNKAARSLVYKYRKLKGATDKARKARKNEIDTAGKALVSRIEGLIAVHDVPLRKEKDRVDRIEGLIHQMASRVMRATEYYSSAELEGDIVILEEYQIDERFEEFQERAEAVRTEGVKTLGDYLVTAQTREAEKAELDRLRKAEQERLAEKVRKEKEELKKKKAAQKVTEPLYPDREEPIHIPSKVEEIQPVEEERPFANPAFNNAIKLQTPSPEPAEEESSMPWERNGNKEPDFPEVKVSATVQIKNEIVHAISLLTTDKGLHVVSPIGAVVIANAILADSIPYVKVIRT